jgi:hypothetical protein
VRLLSPLAGLAGGVAAALLALEIAFRILPVGTSTNTGYYIDPLLLTYPAGQRFTSATGWDLQNARRNHANNYGYVADHDFVENPRAIALIGDSYVEGSMLERQDRFAAQIEAQLRDRPVYSFGSPGTALLDYAERIRFASERFAIRDFVLLLERGDVAQSLCGSGNVAARCLDPMTLEPRIEKQPEPGRVKQLVRQSALAQYVFSQLKLDPVRWLRSLLQREHTPTPTAALPGQKRAEPFAARVIDEFFTRTAPHRRGKLILVLVGEDTDGTQRQLREAAERHGALVIQGEPLLHAASAQTGLSTQVSPRDAHLNRLAFATLAERVAALLARAD